MAAPSPTTVQGDFDDASFTHQGVTSRFSRPDGGYVVTTEGPDGGLADFPVAWAFGVAPVQQYLLALPGGRLQALQIAWDVPGRRWFHLRPDEHTPPGDVLHWTGRSQTANSMCLVCHVTAFEKGYDAKGDTFRSRWVEPNVSCQACHGPGERHVAWARMTPRPPLTERLPGVRGESATAQVALCAPCHARRSELISRPLPGQPYLDGYQPSLLTAGLYHPDGQQLDEVFVDGSFRQSKMFRLGVTCVDCHDPHSGRPKHEGNALCLQCHGAQPNARFPSAAGPYDSRAHHFHPDGTVSCVGCHMPSKPYLQLQSRPDHALQVPRPDLSVKLGTPNACTGCHVEHSAQWAAEQVVAWYGPTRARGPWWGEAFAAARAGQRDSSAGLAKLVGDPLAPAIVRATALDALGADESTALPLRLAATRDPDPQVRAAAADSLGVAPVEVLVQGTVPLLEDPVRAVRIAAARSLAPVPREWLDGGTLAALEAALAEDDAAQRLSLELPGSHFNFAVAAQRTGLVAEAEQHYLDALTLDPDFSPARANLTQLYVGSGRSVEAEQVLRVGLQRNPTQGELHYALGLLLAEQGRLADAAGSLEQAAQLLPTRARVHYNFGLALQQLGKREDAERVLLAAQRLDPADPEIVYALTVFYLQAGAPSRALPWAERLAVLRPSDASVEALLARARGAR